jgi:putative hemolysin
MGEARTILAAQVSSGDMPGLHLIALPVLLILSALCSGSEAVLFSLTPLQRERAAASPDPLRRLAARLMERPRQTLLTILVSNTAVNALLFATSYVVFRNLAARVGTWVTPVSAAASVLLVVVFSEVVPKTVGVQLADRLARYVAPVVRLAQWVVWPVARLLDLLLIEPCLRIAFGTEREGTADSAGLTPAELKALLELSRRSGGLKPLEDTFLRPIVDLGELRVRDVMVPRVQITTYDVNASSEGLRALMRQTRHKKIPVYEGALDNIVGLVYGKVLFFNPDRPLRQLVQPVRFVPEIITCEQLLVHFRQTRTQMAIAVDEYGGVAGLVTLEDVLEQIVGELHDPEEQPEEPDIRVLPDGQYDISGQLSVRYWVDAFGLSPRVAQVATVGGLVMAELGRAAVEGDVVRIGNVELAVARVRRRRIERLRLRLLNRADGELR